MSENKNHRATTADLRRVNIGTTMRSCELLAAIIPLALAYADEHGSLDAEDVVELAALRRLLAGVTPGADVINDFLI